MSHFWPALCLRGVFEKHSDEKQLVATTLYAGNFIVDWN